MKTLKIKGYNDFELSCYIWDKVEKPKGIVQIIHGMQEHARRYNDLAKYLNSQSLIVFASDLRGHGQTALNNNLPLGYSDGDIFTEIVNDQIILTNYLIEKYKLPIHILGHSFGSFIAQKYMIENGFKIKSIILTGSTYTNSFSFKSGYILTSLQKFLGLKKKPARLIENMSLKKYGKHFINGNWLSRDENVWYKYSQDELCGHTFPINFYWSFFKNARKNYKNLKNIPYYLPILIMSGTNDPVCGKKGIFRLFITYGKAMKNVYLKGYRDARHELHNEINKEEIYKDISQFFAEEKLPLTPIHLL